MICPKCECGIELFERDIVDYKTKIIDKVPLNKYDINKEVVTVYRKFRCPKCFKVKKITYV